MKNAQIIDIGFVLKTIVIVAEKMMIETLFLITVIAFVPTDDGYTLWDVTVSDDKFTATQDDRFYGVVGYTPNQFTNTMLKLWEFEKYGNS